MPQYNRAELGRMATESGFVRDTFEKVLRLKEILRFFNHKHHLSEGDTHDQSNLIALCKLCHSQIHAKRGERCSVKKTS